MITQDTKATTTRKCFRIEKRAISFFKHIIEAYDNLAVVETLDPRGGIIALHIAPGCEQTAMEIMDWLGKSYLIETVNEADA